MGNDTILSTLKSHPSQYKPHPNHTHLTKPIKHWIKEDKNSSSCDFRNIVEGLTSIVTDMSILIIKTDQHWLN